MTIQVAESLWLESIQKHHAQPLFELVDANREHLRKWLPWVDHMRSISDFERYITSSRRKEEEKSELGFVIVEQGQVAGRIGLHYFDHQNRTCSIGYWLGAAFTGRGIVSKACARLLDVCFNELGFNRVEIKCGVENKNSAAVPLRLHFTKEGILRQAEWVNGRFVDLQLFSLLKQEWAGSTSADNGTDKNL